jgi:hypothetical protein
MKLEYLADGSPDCPLLRLYDFPADEARELLTAVAALAAGTTDRVEVHRLLFVEPLGTCALTLVRRAWDQAVVRLGPSRFECGLTAVTWDNVAGLIEPFAAGSGGFQWLVGEPGDASVLLSTSGGW